MNLRSLNEFVVVMSAGITTIDFSFLPSNHSLSLSLYIVPAALFFIFVLSLLTSKRNYKIAAFKIILTYSMYCAIFVGLLVPIGQAISYLFESGFEVHGWLNFYGKWALIQFGSGVGFGILSIYAFWGLKRNIGT
ncbi:hypothetical protein ACQKC7_07780 [Pseudoalteromonas tetraodonis]|jgi:hypothetical protein|uniref:hypothetical protein n=2 Tax=Pseudoalteromonas TaxID=53246 RepID=UPI003D00A0FD